jgi:hypothetical protein
MPLPRSVRPEAARFVIVHRLPSGGEVAFARIPTRGRDRSCAALVAFPHPGGETRLLSAGCGYGGLFAFHSPFGGETIIAGSRRGATAVTLAFAGGRSIRAQTSDGFWLAVVPTAAFAKPPTIVARGPAGVTRTPVPSQLLTGSSAPWIVP